MQKVKHLKSCKMHALCVLHRARKHMGLFSKIPLLPVTEVAHKHDRLNFWRLAELRYEISKYLTNTSAQDQFQALTILVNLITLLYVYSIVYY